MLLKAQVLVALERTDEAVRALPRLDPNDEGHLGIRIIQAQTLLALKSQNGYQSARETLQSLLAASGLTEAQSRQTYYLLGVCEEALGDVDRAINQYERTTARYPRSHEGVAASLNEARLLQLAGRDEEALTAYEQALKSVPDPATYHNRWVSINEFRNRILQAWNGWVEGHDYTNAIALSKLMPPLFTVIQARELEARAYAKWAEHYEEQNAQLVLKDPTTYQRQSRERWTASGDAFAALANLLKSSPKYSDVLWISADHYMRGYHFRKAQTQIREFIATAPKERLPLAYVRLAYTELTEDKTQEALGLLERTIQRHPKEPASFEASYLVGIARLERNEFQKAEQTWRDIIESSSLGPAAKEWRESLFALGSTLYHVTSAQLALNGNLEAKLSADEGQRQNPAGSPKSTLVNWDEAIKKLKEYVRRYPSQDKHFQAQYLLARAYQKSAGAYQEKLENAQIANEKQELAKEYHQRLKIATQILRELRTRLLRTEEAAGLSPFETRLLQNAFFDLGDIEFALHDYDSALLVYSGAINRYPNHVRVLLSYMQMAQCYQQLKKTEEARSTLKQAQILAERMNNATFQSPSTNLHRRKQWTDWFDWTLQMSSSPATASSTPNN